MEPESFDAPLQGPNSDTGNTEFHECADALSKLIETIRGRAQTDMHLLDDLANSLEDLSGLLNEEFVLIYPPEERMRPIVQPLGVLAGKPHLKSLRQISQSATSDLEDTGPPLPAVEIWEPFLAWKVVASEKLLGAAELQRRGLGKSPNGAYFAVGPRAEAELRNRQGDRIDELERRAEAAVSHIEAASGAVGSSYLGRAFNEAGETEDSRAKFWTRLVFVCVFAGVAASAAALKFELASIAQLTGLSSVLVKLAFGLPFYLLAAYCGRIASQHRNSASHMRTLTAQLESIRAYVDDLSGDQKDELVTYLGHRAFSRPDVEMADDGHVTLGPRDVVKVLEKALEALGRSGQEE